MIRSKQSSVALTEEVTDTDKSEGTCTSVSPVSSDSDSSDSDSDTCSDSYVDTETETTIPTDSASLSTLSEELSSSEIETTRDCQVYHERIAVGHSPPVKVPEPPTGDRPRAQWNSTLIHQNAKMIHELHDFDDFSSIIERPNEVTPTRSIKSAAQKPPSKGKIVPKKKGQLQPKSSTMIFESNPLNVNDIMTTSLSTIDFYKTNIDQSSQSQQTSSNHSNNRKMVETNKEIMSIYQDGKLLHITDTRNGRGPRVVLRDIFSTSLSNIDHHNNNATKSSQQQYSNHSNRMILKKRTDKLTSTPVKQNRSNSLPPQFELSTIPAASSSSTFGRQIKRTSAHVVNTSDIVVLDSFSQQYRASAIPTTSLLSHTGGHTGYTGGHTGGHSGYTGGHTSRTGGHSGHTGGRTGHRNRTSRHVINRGLAAQSLSPSPRVKTSKIMVFNQQCDNVSAVPATRSSGYTERHINRPPVVIASKTTGCDSFSQQFETFDSDEAHSDDQHIEDCCIVTLNDSDCQSLPVTIPMYTTNSDQQPSQYEPDVLLEDYW